MKGLVLIFFLPLWVFAQEESAYPAIHSLTYSSEFHEQTSLLATPFQELDLLKNRLEGKKHRFKSDKDFLAYIFTQTHQRLLKNYVENSSYQELINQGNYNCLTATTVYALALKHFGYSYSIIETNYHIFLMVQTQAGKVLLETTDPLNGFVDREDEIENRIASYKENKTLTREDQYYFSFSLYHEVTLTELEGLLYYNESVRQFNAKQFEAAINSLNKAYTNYYSARVDEFSKVLLLCIAQNDQIALAQKAGYIKQLQIIRKSRLEITASK